MYQRMIEYLYPRSPDTVRVAGSVVVLLHSPPRDLAVGGRPPAPGNWVTKRLGTCICHKWVTNKQMGNKKVEMRRDIWSSYEWSIRSKISGTCICQGNGSQTKRLGHLGTPVASMLQQCEWHGQKRKKIGGSTAGWQQRQQRRAQWQTQPGSHSGRSQRGRKQKRLGSNWSQ